ncbi:MAG: hypothetical protein HQL70_11045 [Magnetococcales bacterium]|nr:hypothetical protein [Magnetococcales bacterium]
MARQAEEELLQQMRNMRRRTGIKQIPFSDAEINSGMVSAVASAMGSRKPEPEKPKQFIARRVERRSQPPPPATPQPAEEPEIPSGIGTKPLNHKRSFSIKC